MYRNSCYLKDFPIIRLKSDTEMKEKIMLHYSNTKCFLYKPFLRQA